MKQIFLIIIGLSISSISIAQKATPIGQWKTVDDETGKEKSIVEIYEQKGKLYGKVIKLLPGAASTTCDKCPGDKKGKPIVGMVFLTDLEKDGDEYDGGTILDPAKGKEYSCKISLEKPDVLLVRGYMGFSLLGRTQKWYRVK